MKSPKKSKSKSDSNSMVSKSSALFLLGMDKEYQQEPVPLQIYGPTFSLRRSPRFTTPSPQRHNVRCKNAKRSKSEPKTQHKSGLKRSPRFSPGSYVGAEPRNVSNGRNVSLLLRRSPRLNNGSLNMILSQTTDSPDKKRGSKRMFDLSALRRSPSFSPVSEDPQNVLIVLDPDCAVCRNVSLGDTRPMSLRRSPRLGNGNVELGLRETPDSVDNKSNGKKKRGMDNCEQRMFDERAVRRSPRFVSASVGAQNNKKEMDFALVKSQRYEVQSLTMKEEEGEKNLNEECLNEKFISRSPGLSSVVFGTETNSSKAALQMISSQALECSAKDGSTSVSLRTSDCKLVTSRELEAKPLFLSWHEDDDRMPVPLTFYDSRASTEKYLRRSPRFILPTNNDINNGLLREHFTSSSDEKQLLRSPYALPPCNAVGNIKVNSDFKELSDKPDERLSKKVKTLENSDLGTLDGKFLRRSPRMTNSAFGAKNGSIECSLTELHVSVEKHSPKESGKHHPPEKVKPLSLEKKQKKVKVTSSLTGDPLPIDEAQKRWCWRYEMKSQRSKSQRLKIDDDDEDKIVWNVECHYTQAEIDGCIFYLGDCGYIKGEGGQKHVGRIVEFFKTTVGEDYFRVQWFYRAEDTVMKEEAAFHDKKRLFYSTVMNDNPLDCIISKVSVIYKSPMMGLNSHLIPSSNFYFDMEYCVDYSTFRTLLTDSSFNGHDSSSSDFADTVCTKASKIAMGNIPSCESLQAELVLLDLFSGCGGMSTGLCLGAKVSGIDLVTKWALDSDKSACESLKLNHPETHVRNEAAEDFLELLKEWDKLCKQYAVNDVPRTHQSISVASRVATENANSLDDADILPGEYEVSKVVDICYGDPDETGERGLKFKVHWKGYGTSEDTWEPIEGLSNCQECIQDFVRNGFKSKILPLPGDVDLICGGPPCQGISGYNRYRNIDSPLTDERNRQIVVFMDIVQFLKPKFVLMENVADILRFDKASLARYALSRLVRMKYQARLGTMAAGCYGLPQFRLRVFLWGAHAHEKLPQFPLPTHDVIVRYWPSPEFERNTVAYDEDQARELEKAIVLQDAISDLPAVTSHEAREEITHERPPETEFQKYIRSTIYEMTGSTLSGTTSMNSLLYDHRPYSLSEEDYARLCRIPKQKGANFRDLPGVVVGTDNVVRRDPTVDQILLPSGKPLVPDFAFTFEQGKSKRPYARLWWDETVSTVVTFPNLRNSAVIHPEQDRVLTIRECARLQGFPDYYRFCGTVKDRYRQIGNAVAVPVGRALGYALGMAFQGLSGDEPLMMLPPKFSHSTNLQLAKSLFQKTD